MIQKIQLHNVATYSAPVSMQPLAINFCYGNNGSGKSTLANVISGEIVGHDCSVSWARDKLSVLIYNKAFVESKFSERIGGIFTLGEESKDALDFIANKKLELETIDRGITRLTNTRTDLEQQKQQAKSSFERTCWAIQQEHGAKFAEALTGHRGSKEKFSKQCLELYSDTDKNSPPDINTIQELYAASYSVQKEQYSEIQLIDVNSVLTSEINELLNKRITGSTHTSIGMFIEYLQNSDWVKQGISYADNAQGKCPFCQQIIPENICQELSNFFDESYEKDCNMLAEFGQQYSQKMTWLLERMQTVIQANLPILEYDLFRLEVEKMAVIIESNKKKIADKITSPGTEVILKSLSNSLLRLNSLIVLFNEKISRNNEIVKNQAQNQEKCKTKIWNFFIYELREIIAQYQRKIAHLDIGIKKISEKLGQENAKMTSISSQITEKEKTLTSVLPTVNEINAILERFGFTGFKLAENPDISGTYKIIRPDGANAKKTLSEGEHNFIAFLYFFHLVYGSFERSGIAQDKVVIIDDPISSLDSNVLFIITTLVKTLINDCLENKHGVKQIFVLTHNIYFHKEITFRGSRKEYPPTQTAYWIIRKKENSSVIDRFSKNPIQTSYQLLWADLKDIEGIQRATVFNSLRRILEYYFNIIGGLDYEDCIRKFDGQDKIICNALLASINDGSHFISDDFVMCYESDALENYLRVFHLIFDKMGHESHYNMMMQRGNISDA